MQTDRRIVKRYPAVPLVIIASLLLTGCTAGATAEENATEQAAACPMTEIVRAIPPTDAAVLDEPAESDYFINADRSIWASAWWAKAERESDITREEGFKVGWFRPEGADLEITGKRLDGKADPLESHVPCCYPTRFQASGLYFPAPGCWEVTARAADSTLTFVVYLDE